MANDGYSRAAGTSPGRILAAGCLAAALMGMSAGCAVTQPQDMPAPEIAGIEPRTGRSFSLYVPSTYEPSRKWPVVIALHGTFGFDGHKDQVREWKALAEQHRFIVAAPELRSTQGILPRIGALWYADLESDERAILGLLDELEQRYNVDPNNVLLTGFSSGGYPMYWAGLRNPGRFGMLIARQGNCDTDMLEAIPLGPAARKLPVVMIYGSSDLWLLRNQAFAAQEYLSEHGACARLEAVEGGHLRHPEVACTLWRKRCWPVARPRRNGPGVDQLVPLEAPPAGSAPAVRIQPAVALPKAVAAGTAAKKWHTVRRGETYWSLAERYLGSGRRWKEIADANPGARGGSLRVGQKVAIPSRGP